MPRATWTDRKPTTPYGSVPVLEIEGKGTLGESNAILTYIGRGHGLHPQDAWEAAKHEAIMSAVEHLRHKPGATALKDDAEKKAAREAFATGPLAPFARRVEAQLGGGPYVAGENISVADIKLYMMMRVFVANAIDHVPGTVFAAYSKLTRLFEATQAHPRVAAWVASHARP